MNRDRAFGTTGQAVKSRLCRRPAVAALFAVAVLAMAIPAAAQSGSNASNYQNGAQLSINGRTGDVSTSLTIVRLPGVVSELGLNLALSYRSEDARSAIPSNMRFFGLPYGWSLGLSFIYNDAGTVKLNVDGSSVYKLDDGWRTSFRATGSDTNLLAKTGLSQYSRADATLKADDGTVNMNGIISAFVFTNLQGEEKYFTNGGLMIRERDRFGNVIDYQYSNRATGGAISNSTSPENAELAAMIDTWGNTVTIGSCTDPQTCVANETRVTLPDGRTVGWVSPDAFRITELIDTEGMVTHLEWENSTCGDQEYGNRRLIGMSTPVGGLTSLTYTCLDVCRSPSSTQCTDTTSWSVVDAQYECPNNTSGQRCPAGSTSSDFLTTRYAYGTSSDHRNYTGYPRYSPYQPAVADADALMSAPDAGSFQYTTIASKHRTNGATIHQTETDYNFLHLEQEQRVLVPAEGSASLTLSKLTSSCYPINDDEPAADCPLITANYQSLPSNYQSPIITGSCQFNVDGSATGQARHSVVTMAYDAFGNTIRKRKYHATESEGIISTCDRAASLSTSGMLLVTEDHMQYDTPTSLDGDGFVDIGKSSGHFGLMLGQQSFVYLDEDNSGVGAHHMLQSSDSPVLVKLQCNQLTTGTGGGELAGANIKTSTTGLMSNDATAPTTLGIIDACPQPGDDNGIGASWTGVPAPPKTVTFSYDDLGRSMQQITTWAEGYAAPDGVASTSQSFAYSMTTTNDGEEACDGDSSVLQIVSTDTEGYSTTNRLCTLNGFHLSAADANNNTTLMEHSANGLTTKTTHADGTSVETQFYYACPLAQDGQTQTCPSSATILRDCPYDSASQKRNCTAKTMSSGEGKSSFVDGVMHVMIRDGLGRIVEELDNLGGSGEGAGFDAIETTKRMIYDDRGMLASRVESMGATDPLVYTTLITLDTKLRPSLLCGPRRETHQFIHDDVRQRTMTIFNGSDREGYVTNDSDKLTTIANCDLVSGQTTSGEDENCATVASDMSSPDCAGDAYFTYTLHDGSGQEHSVVAMAGLDVDDGASVTGINGITTYNADLLKYGYSVTSDNQADNQTTASSTFARDLQGQLIEQVLSVDVTDNTQPTPSTTSSTFASDHFEFNGIDQKIRERNKLSDLPGAPALEETYSYDPVGNLSTLTTYAGVTFQNYYDERNRLVRHCFPTDSGSEGEKMVLDPVTGAVLMVTRFTNPGDCSEDDSGDVEVVSETYTYTRFGAVESITYGDGTRLAWAYDAYHRMACFADALATSNGNDCPDSPVAVGYAPDPSQLLVWYSYFSDSDSYRRGLMQSKCRGVPDGNGGFVTKCMETDYYTSVDAGGACADDLSGIVGAFASLVKSETYCTGGTCTEGDLVYTTTYLYDEHRRPCDVTSVNGSGAVIFSSKYDYDQFDNVVHEENTSDLDTSDDSNYQIDYVYDGLLRLVGETRSDSGGDLIKKTTYEYDAASNLKRKIEEEPDGPGDLDTPTPGPEGTLTVTPELTDTPESTETPAPTGTAEATATTSPRRTATNAPPTEARGSGDDDGCQVSPAAAPSASMLLVALALAVGWARGRRRRLGLR